MSITLKKYILTFFIILTGSLIGLHLNSPDAHAEKSTSTTEILSCEDQGCSTEEPECVDNEGTYGCTPKPDVSTCVHSVCGSGSNPGEN